MTLSINELAQVREVVGNILDQLQLEAYLFEVEPQEGQWEIKLECTTGEGCWETFRLTAKKEYLLRGVDDAVLHELFLDDWREVLSPCLIKSTEKTHRY